MDQYVKLAEQAVERYINNGTILNVPKDLSPEFYSRRAGVFVTIRQGNKLRGCIGTFMPTKNNIAAEIVSNAIAACSRDYRFAPIRKEELPKLSYEVSILSEPKLVENLEYHNPKKHGLIAKCTDGRCGLLLPDIVGVDTTEQQLLIVCQKGNINPGLDKFTLWEFETEKHQQTEAKPPRQIDPEKR